MSLFRRIGTKPAKPADPCTMPGCSVHAAILNAGRVPLRDLEERVNELLSAAGLDQHTSAVPVPISPSGSFSTGCEGLSTDPGFDPCGSGPVKP